MEIRMTHDATGGEVSLIGSPIKYSETPADYRRAPPMLGQHSEEVLEERRGRAPAEGAACLWGIQIRGGPEVTARIGRPGGNVSAQRYEVLSFNSGGSGARPGQDGMSATAFPSGVRAMSSELFETLAPIVVWRKELRADSGGVGETRGGLGQTGEVGTVDGAPFALYAMFDRVDHPARGRYLHLPGHPTI